MPSISQGRDVEGTEIAQMMIERNDYPRYNTYEEKKMIFDFVSRDSPVIQTIADAAIPPKYFTEQQSNAKNQKACHIGII